MVETGLDFKAAVLRQSQTGCYELLLSDGRRRASGIPDPPVGKPSAAWSPDGNWLGVLCGNQVSILDSSLGEVWTATPGVPPVCCWDRTGTRLFVGNADSRAHACDSFAPAGSDVQANWRAERRRWRACVPNGTAEPADAGEVPVTEAVWLPSPRDELLVSITTEPENFECAADSRLVILPFHAIASSPLAELAEPWSEMVSQVRWSADGNSLAWVCSKDWDRQELKVWRYGCDKIKVLLRWPGSTYHLHEVNLSPSGKHVLVVLTEYAVRMESPHRFDRLNDHTIVVCVTDGEATIIPDVPGVDIAEWDSDDEIHLAYDLQPEASGGYAYQWAEKINISRLPVPWSVPGFEGVVFIQPPATASVLHQGCDYTGILPRLPASAATHRVELVLTDPDTGELICRGEFGPDAQAPDDAPILVVLGSGTQDQLLLIGVSAQSARIVPLLAFDLPGPPPLLHLTVWPVGSGSGEQGAWSFIVPVLRAAASFRCEADGVESIAIWVR
jgi:hypothetical protein